MTVITREVDQWIEIGGSMLLGPTDIDGKIVRLLAHGRMIGGPEDGGTFKSVHEASPGQSFALGPLIVVTIVDIHADAVRIGLNVPKHLTLHRKEVTDSSRRERPES